MDTYHYEKDKSFLSFCEDYSLSEINGRVINAINFKEISNYIEISFLEYCPDVKGYPQFLKSVAASISNQLFDLLKIPLLYSANNRYYIS